jgi:hypothetical protein
MNLEYKILGITPVFCKNCQGENFTWYAGKRNMGGVQDGLIKMNEIEPIFFLGCDECSETLSIINADFVAEIMTEIIN